ncbi:metal ABC transporter permease [Methanobacterium alkalithermotolerans]|uniref:Metal ABC transporter permease n=1 Tax=Methanobacterium alkalithermotolerans TaxID=2731220 RepID=A0A8T8K7Y4_9EURY|nr:metal ABC transporter permease [Methanobacterium alkalithermotolerans]QUH24009.1 metal ABC transporter permease [Methanobacterium alkalithermotolerans]
MLEFLQYQFMQNAFIAAILVSISCGVVGTYVVIKKIVFISGGISHAAFGGIGLGYLLGINPVLSAIPFSVFSAVLMGSLGKKVEISEDTAIGILWSVGMALGIIFINLSPGYAPDLFSYLFGSILTVPYQDLLIMVVLDLIILGTVGLFYREFAAISFDEEFAEVMGVPSHLIYIILLGLVALSVVVLIKAVGIILIIALLTIPAAISRQFTHNIPKLMMTSVILGIILTSIGLWLSYLFNLASGATIVLVLGVAFFVSAILKKIWYD